MIPKQISQAIWLLALLCFCACTKTVDRWSDKTGDTVHDTLTTLADNRIVSFQVRNTGEVSILGVVNDSTHAVTVYLPFYYELVYLQPRITVPDGATVFPGPDSLVNILDTAAIRYTVTGKSGAKATYTVHTVMQQPDLRLYDVSDADNTTVYDISSKYVWIGVAGENIIPSFNVTTMYVVDKDGKRLYQFREGDPLNASTSQIQFQIGQQDKSIFKNDTDYWLELQCYSLVARMQYPVRFKQ